MKKNNKGFLLAETIVTVCIIATLSTSIYLYISKTSSRFEERDNYENVVEVYKANTLKQYLEKKNYSETSSTALTEETLGVLNDEENLNIKEAYLIENKESSKDEILAATTSQAFKDYLNWISIEDDESKLRLIVWFNSGDSDGTFANLLISK